MIHRTDDLMVIAKLAMKDMRSRGIKFKPGIERELEIALTFHPDEWPATREQLINKISSVIDGFQVKIVTPWGIEVRP